MAVAEKYPQYTNGIAAYSKNEKNSYCYICPNELPIVSEEHLKNSDHLSTLAHYLHNFTDNGPFVCCKLCSMWLKYSSIKEHAITHKLMPWYKPEEESLIKSNSMEKNDESLPSSRISQVNCSPAQEVNIEGCETTTAKKKSVRTRGNKEVIHTGNIVSTSFRKFRAYAERLSHVMADKRKPSTIEEENEPGSFEVVQASPENFKIRRFSIRGFKAADKHVDARKHTKQVKDQKPKRPKLRKFRDWFLGVSDRRKGESIPMTSNVALPSSSPEKYELRNRKISLDSIAGHNDEKLDNNKQLMRESVKSIYSPGDEVFMTECRICKAIILSDWKSRAEDVDSKRHEKTRVIVSYLHEPQFVLEIEPKLNKHDEIKYFIADKQVEGDESIINVVEVPKGETKDSGICFTWCSACCIKVYDDSYLNEHLKSPFHLENSKEKFIICKSSHEEDDNDDSESDERDQHKNYPEGVKEIHGGNCFLGTIRNGHKLFDKDSVFEHKKSLVHLDNLQRSLGSGETGEDDVFSNEINWKTSAKSAGGEKTTAQSLSPDFQSKNAEGSSSENDFLSCSSKEDPKMNAGPSEAQIVTSMAQMDLNSEGNEKASQNTEVPFSKESCSSLNYEQREENDWAELCSGSDGRMGNEDIEFKDEFVVNESASNLQMPENASTPQILENIRVTGDQTAASLGDTYNIEGTDIWFCLACNNEKIYTPHSMNAHLTDIKHSNRKMQMLSKAPKQLNQTRFIISPEFRTEGIAGIPTKKFAICTLCKSKLHHASNVESHLSGKHHLALKKCISNRKNEGKLQLSGDGLIDFIECKVNNLSIHGIEDIPANNVDAFHMQSEVHRMKEMEFAEEGRPSLVPSISGSRSSTKSSKPSSKSSSSGSMARFIGFSPDVYGCPICHEVLKSKKQIHSHLTSHFWRRFIEKPPPVTDEALEELAKSEPLKCTEDSDDESVINESPLKTLERTRFRKRLLDVEVAGSINIYEIDKQRMSEIKAGVLLSLPKDNDTIYCLICRCNISNNLQTFYEHLCSVKHLDFLKDMLEDDELFQNRENQLSDLALCYEYMEDISDAVVNCHACGMSIENKSAKLYEHINSTNHIDKWIAIDRNSRELFRGLKSKMECDFYSVRKYWCVICGLKFITEYEFQKHLIRRKHLKKIRKFNHEFLMFDYCRICASLWYGFLKTFSYHSDCKMHKYHKLDGFFSINQLPESAELLLNSPEEEIEAILKGLEFRRAIDKSKEDQLLRDLRAIAVVKYPNAVVHPFGSRITGLGGKNSDLDVFLDCPTQNNCMYFGENSQPELIERRLVKIKECLENNSNIWHIDREILNCRIPIIKIKHKPTDIECDLSFTNGLTVENTALIRNYCDKSADCRKLIIFIKNWMNHCELSGANGINSYGIAWLVIYFLQTKKILPTVNQLIQMNNKSQIIAGWETGVSKDFQVQTFDGSFGELLNEFFKFYGNFDYRHDVICPLLGEIVKKIDFQHRGELPSAMRPYLNYLRDASNAELFRVDSIMCLQDPFDLAHNITKAVKKFNIYQFKTFCCYSTKIIHNDV